MKASDVVLLEEASDDLELGRRFYEEREAGIGRYFADTALADLASLRLYAGIHSVRFGYHRMLVKRFPFAAYYEIVEDIARVVAVLDMRRDPESIRAILAKRKSQQADGGNA